MQPDQGHDHNSLDELLDSGLRRLGHAEPRPGLETRVLATIRAQKERRPLWTLKATWAGGMALLFLATAIWAFYGREDRSRTAAGNPPARGIPAKPPAPEVARMSKGNAAASMSKPRSLPRLVTPKAARKTVNLGAPHLAQFPSPQPLSQQEKMLARYVQQRPQEARLLARAQTELLRQDLLEFEAKHGTQKDTRPATQ